jgi:hypothetical protein
VDSISIRSGLSSPVTINVEPETAVETSARTGDAVANATAISAARRSARIASWTIATTSIRSQNRSGIRPEVHIHVAFCLRRSRRTLSLGATRFQRTGRLDMARNDKRESGAAL